MPLAGCAVAVSIFGISFIGVLLVAAGVQINWAEF
jgi:hypothetical protein